MGQNRSVNAYPAVVVPMERDEFQRSGARIILVARYFARLLPEPLGIELFFTGIHERVRYQREINRPPSLGFSSVIRDGVGYGYSK